MLSLICITNLMPCATQERLKPPPPINTEALEKFEAICKGLGISKAFRGATLDGE